MKLEESVNMTLVVAALSKRHLNKYLPGQASQAEMNDEKQERVAAMLSLIKLLVVCHCGIIFKKSFWLRVCCEFLPRLYNIFLTLMVV